MIEYERGAFERIRQSDLFKEDPDGAVAALQRRLEAIVDRVLSSRRSVRPAAEQLLRFRQADRERFISTVEFMADTSVELAFNFCLFAISALKFIDSLNWEAWVVHILEIYDERGVTAAIAAMQKVQAEAASYAHSTTRADLERVSRVLEGFIHGLNGRPLRLEEHSLAYTDTETLFVPAAISSFDDPKDNFRLYKALSVHLWAQTWFGTWRVDPAQECADYPMPERALALFHTLERLRLDACIQREFPGIAREMARLRELEDTRALPSPWIPVRARLSEPWAQVQDSLQLLESVYRFQQDPEAVCYQGILQPERVREVRQKRLERERQDLARLLSQLAEELKAERHPKPPAKTPARFHSEQRPDEDQPEGFTVDLTLDGVPVTPPDNVRQLIDSILQDLGRLPEEYLEAAGHGAYRPSDSGPAPEPSGPTEEEGIFFYDEWDHVRQNYRKQWCLLRERPPRAQSPAFVSETLRRHRGLIKHLRRTFEALREDDSKLRRQPDGEDIDLDAVVQAYADRHGGLEPSDRLFTRNRRRERNIAVMFMVDMSGSTEGWINDMEREALVLLCESLEILGDRYAIYGFSGFTHRRCELFPIKGFEEAYTEEVKARISGIRPQDYTRMGAAIRHLSALLGAVEARTKLLIALSDGRPDDQDGYRGRYGIEDTRTALMETRCLGIHPYCITIDEEALDYLPHMYGPASFTVVDRIDRLPYRVSDIYRRITM